MTAVRVGVLLDTVLVPAWAAWILGEIVANVGLKLALAVIRDDAGNRRRPTLFSLYEALDRQVFPTRPNALALVDVSGLLAGVPRARDPGEIRRHGLDVLLALGSGRPEASLLGTARHGVWAYRYGDPPLFEPVFDAAPVTETALELHDPRGTAVIYRSTGTTDVVSLNRNRVPILWKSARFAIRRLDGLASGTWEPPGERGQPPPRPQAARASPDAAVVLRHAGRVAGRVARRKLRNATQQHQWFLGTRRRPADRLPGDDAAAWHTVVPPPDRSYADPFVLAHGHRTFVFFEVLDHASGLGSLAVGHLDDGALTGIEPILPMPHHTSYPYVFRDGEDIFLIPETGDARRVDLFAAVDFPTGWEHVATLIEGVNAVDASVIRHGGRYWMWVTIAVPGGRLYDETFLYSSDRLEAGWAPHPGNPVVSDARHARPAGRPFLHEGRLIRPCQSCAGRYGERVMLNEVEALTHDEYRERSRGFLGPEWTGGPNLAAHTYTFDDGWEVTDGLRLFRRGPLGTARRRR